MASADLDRELAAWLTEQEGRDVRVHGLSFASAGARRLNALFDATSDGGTQRLALTMIPSAAIQLLDVAGEAAVRTLAENAGVPVPHIHHVCSDESVLGGPFFLSTAVDGESVPRRVLRLAHQHDVGERVVEQIGNALACLHSVDPASAPAVLPRPTGTGPIATIMTTVNTLLDGLLDPSPVFSYGVRWLERNAPTEPDRMTVVHTDVRTGNIIVGEDGLARCSTGRPRESVTRWKISPGPASGCGGSARTPTRSAVSARSLPFAAHTRRPEAPGTRTASSGGGCWERSAGDSAWQARLGRTSTAASRRS